MFCLMSQFMGHVKQALSIWREADQLFDYPGATATIQNSEADDPKAASASGAGLLWACGERRSAEHLYLFLTACGFRELCQ